MEATPKILVVDDEKALSLFLAETLTRDGYEVTVANSGEKALDYIAKAEFDVVLLDLKLGDIDGTDILTTLHLQSPGTVTILLTAHASLETAIQALRQGAHDYLFKPCKTVELRQSIRRGLATRQREIQHRHLLRQIQHLTNQLEDVHPISPESPLTTHTSLNKKGVNNAQQILKCGDLIVDFIKHVVTLDGVLLELSPTEFNLLAYLVEETPRVITPKELVHEVQGYQTEQWEASETVRSHIYHIRQKIKKATGRKDIIRTVRGRGYSINEAIYKNNNH